MNKQETMTVALGILHVVINYIQQNPYLLVIVAEQCPYVANNRQGAVPIMQANIFIYLLGLLASVTDGSWPCVVG